MLDLIRTNRNFINGYNPFREMEEFERNFFGNTFRDFFTSSPLAEFKTDIREEDGVYVLDADLPGFAKEDIHLEINNEILTISAERSSEKSEEKDGKYLRQERSFGKYTRSFNVSEIDTENIKAKYNNGVLTLTLPKKQVSLPETKTLEIE